MNFFIILVQYSHHLTKVKSVQSWFLPRYWNASQRTRKKPCFFVFPNSLNRYSSAHYPNAVFYVSQCLHWDVLMPLTKESWQHQNYKSEYNLSEIGVTVVDDSSAVYLSQKQLPREMQSTLSYHSVRGLYFLAVVFCGDYRFVRVWLEWHAPRIDCFPSILSSLAHVYVVMHVFRQ